VSNDPFRVPEPPSPVGSINPAGKDTDAPPAIVSPAEPPAPDTAPAKRSKRPTTRAERAAASAARKAQAAASGKTDTKPKSTSTPRKASLETRLTGSLVTLGTVTAVSGGMVSPAFAQDGVLITEHAASIASALAKVADDQPQVKAALERMLTAGVWSGLVAAMLPLVVGIAANHGAIPPHLAAMLGATVPEPAPAGPAMPQGFGVV
jgi:hypothetical protein